MHRTDLAHMRAARRALLLNSKLILTGQPSIRQIYKGDQRNEPIGDLDLDTGACLVGISFRGGYAGQNPQKQACDRMPEHPRLLIAHLALAR